MTKHNRDTDSAALERGAVSDVGRLFKSWFFEIGTSALVDDLTHLFNRRYLVQRLVQEVERARRVKGQLSLLIADIDGFGRLNETYGSHRGDDILHTMAILLADNVRKSDVLCRYGGDVFAVLLPDTNQSGAEVAARRIQDKVARHQFKGGRQETTLTLTITIGTATYPEEKTSWSLLRRGLASLAAAKAKARGGVYHLGSKEMAGQKKLDFDCFVGRNREMSVLGERLAGASGLSDTTVSPRETQSSNRGAVVFITGNTGVGKTRLLLELAQKAQESDFTVLYGKAQPLGIGCPYQPFIDAIRYYLRDRRLGDGERLEQLFGVHAPQLVRYLPEVCGFGDGGTRPAPPEHERQRLYEGIAQFFVNVSQERPLLLILDDLQWSSESDLDLIHFITRSIAAERFVLCGAYRTDETRFFAMQFKEKLGRIQADGLGDELHLDPLTKEESDGLVEGMLNRLRFPREVQDVIYSLTEGNPLHIVELTKALFDEGILTFHKNEWSFDSSRKLTWLESIGSIIEHRIAALDGVTDNLLATAAVVGEFFSFDVIKLVTGLNEGRLMSIIDKSLDTRLIAEMPGSVTSHFMFRHSFIQAKFYERLSETRLRHLHSQIASALEKVYSHRLIEVYGELGWHYAESGDAGKALEYSIKAARSMQEVYAYQEASSYYRMAAKISEKYGTARAPDRLAIYEGLGDICLATGDLRQAIENYNMLTASDAPNFEPKDKARLWLKIGRVHQKRAEYNEALACFDLAKSFVQGEKGFEELARIRVARAGVLYQRSQYKEALTELEEIFSMGDSDTEYLGEAHTVAGAVCAKFAQFDRAMEHYNKALGIWERLGTLFSVARVNNNIGTVHFMKGDYDLALKYFEQSRDFYERVGDVLDRSQLLNNIGSIYNNICQWDKSLEYFAEALSILTRLGNRHVAGVVLANIGSALLKKGSLDEAFEKFQKAQIMVGEFGDLYGLGMVNTDLARYYLAKGDQGRALDCVEQAEASAGKGNLQEVLLDAKQVRVELLIEQARIDEARELAQAAVGEAQRIGNRTLETNLRLSLARVNLAGKDLAGAREGAEQAIAMAEAVKNRHLVGRGKMLQGLAAGDPKERGRLLQEARAIFEELGAALDLKRLAKAM